MEHYRKIKRQLTYINIASIEINHSLRYNKNNESGFQIFQNE